MGQKGEYVPQTILQTKTENDTAGSDFDGNYILCVPDFLYQTITNRGRTQRKSCNTELDSGTATVDGIKCVKGIRKPYIEVGGPCLLIWNAGY